MTKFTQSAFVRVEDTEQRKELCEWLEGIGYKRGLVSCLRPNYNNDEEEVVSCQINGQYSLIADRHANMLLNMDVGFIDCGTNTAMFKALAALRDDTDCHQWIIGYNGNWKLSNWYCSNSNPEYPCRKATPAEIVEHFKD